MRLPSRHRASTTPTPFAQYSFKFAVYSYFDSWVEACPLRYSSPNASRARDVLGTLMLGILAGSKGV
jgi:hypothetical protein